MIAFVEGKLEEKQPTSIVVSVSGVGLQVEIPASSFHSMGSIGDTARVLTHLSVREDAWTLYGFATREERGLFRQLISVSGIGPKVALSVLSGISVSDFAAAVLTEDVKALSSIPGIGKKTAARLVMELRESVNQSAAGSDADLPLVSAGDGQTVINDTLMGLVELGYERSDARKAIAKITNQSNEEFTAESLIRMVLQQRGR